MNLGGGIASSGLDWTRRGKGMKRVVVRVLRLQPENRVQSSGGAADSEAAEPGSCPAKLS